MAAVNISWGLPRSPAASSFSSSGAATAINTRRRRSSSSSLSTLLLFGSKSCKKSTNNVNFIAPIEIPPPLSAAAAAAAALPYEFHLSPPPIDHDPLEFMMNDGASGEDLAVSAALHGVACQYYLGSRPLTFLPNQRHYGLVASLVTGDDRIQFLHNQTTAKFDSLAEGEGCDTVLVTPTARTIDIAHSWIMKNSVMLLVSPGTCKNISEMLQKYIFYADKVEVHDIREQTCFFVLVGPKSNQVMKALKLDDLIGQPYGTNRHYAVNGMPVTVGVGSVVSRDGFSFMLSPSSLGELWEVLISLGAVPMDSNAWERLRILHGRPAPGKELTNDFNVLEAGLWEAVSLDKGCYKGQETISRLKTYNGVKQKLWGIQLSGPVEPGSAITTVEDGKKVGVLTSCSVGREAGEHFGLGYVKRQFDLGGQVCIGNVVGTLVHAPFLSYYSPS